MPANTNRRSYDGGGSGKTWGNETNQTGLDVDQEMKYGVPSETMVSQVIWRPIAASTTGIFSGAVNLSQGDELPIPFTLDNARRLVIAYAGIATDDFEIQGLDGWKNQITHDSSAGASPSGMTFGSTTKLIWRKSTPFVGNMDIGWNDTFGAKWPVMTNGSPLLDFSMGAGAGVFGAVNTPDVIGRALFGIIEAPNPMTLSAGVNQTLDAVVPGQLDARGLVTPTFAIAGTVHHWFYYHSFRVEDRDRVFRL